MHAQTTTSNLPRTGRARRRAAGALAAIALLVGAGAAHATPAPVAVIDTGAMVNPALTPTVTLAGGAPVADPRSHGSLMLTTIAGPGAPGAGGAVSHYGCDAPGGGVDGACALDALNDALARGARVVSLSWSVDMGAVDGRFRDRFADAVARARADGVVIAAAAYPGGPTFPADIPGVVSVGAVERDGHIAYPGDNAQLRLPTENTDGVDASGARIVRAGSSFATAEFAARAARILGAEPTADIGALPGRVVAEMAAAVDVADRADVADAADVPRVVGDRAGPRAARVNRAQVRRQAVALRRAVALRATWRGGRLVVVGRVPARAKMDVMWRSTRFACAPRRCSVRLIGPRTRHVQVRVSRGGVAVVVRVAARGR